MQMRILDILISFASLSAYTRILQKKLYMGRKLEAYDGKQLDFEEILAQYA